MPLLRNFSKTRSIDRRLGKFFVVILHIMASECSADKCTTVRFIPLVKNENLVSLTKHTVKVLIFAGYYFSRFFREIKIREN